MTTGIRMAVPEAFVGSVSLNDAEDVTWEFESTDDGWSFGHAKRLGILVVVFQLVLPVFLCGPLYWSVATYGFKKPFLPSRTTWTTVYCAIFLLTYILAGPVAALIGSLLVRRRAHKGAVLAYRRADDVCLIGKSRVLPRSRVKEILIIRGYIDRRTSAGRLRGGVIQLVLVANEQGAGGMRREPILLSRSWHQRRWRQCQAELEKLGITTREVVLRKDAIDPNGWVPPKGTL